MKKAHWPKVGLVGPVTYYAPPPNRSIAATPIGAACPALPASARTSFAARRSPSTGSQAFASCCGAKCMRRVAWPGLKVLLKPRNVQPLQPGEPRMNSGRRPKILLEGRNVCLGEPGLREYPPAPATLPLLPSPACSMSDSARASTKTTISVSATRTRGSSWRWRWMFTSITTAAPPSWGARRGRGPFRWPEARSPRKRCAGNGNGPRPLVCSLSVRYHEAPGHGGEQFFRLSEPLY